jgi:uncharacterized protein
VGSPITDPLLSRPVPAFDPLAAFFWVSGADEQLRMLRCGDCGFYVHPPSHPCPQCFSAEVAPAVVCGDGTVAAFTVNVQEWSPVSVRIRSRSSNSTSSRDCG